MTELSTGESEDIDFCFRNSDYMKRFRVMGFFFLAAPSGMKDPNSPTRGPGIEPVPHELEGKVLIRESMVYWTTREVPRCWF